VQSDRWSTGGRSAKYWPTPAHYPTHDPYLCHCLLAAAWSCTIPAKCDDQWHALWQCHIETVGLYFPQHQFKIFLLEFTRWWHPQTSFSHSFLFSISLVKPLTYNLFIDPFVHIIYHLWYVPCTHPHPMCAFIYSVEYLNTILSILTPQSFGYHIGESTSPLAYLCKHWVYVIYV